MSHRASHPESHPAAVLDRLRHAVPDAEPVVLESLGPPDQDVAGEAVDSALDFLFRRMEVRFHELVDELRESLGTPHFVGSVEEESFPAWSDALLLATWWHGDTVVYLAVRNESDADPVILQAGAHARDELEQLQSWGPPDVGE